MQKYDDSSYYVIIHTDSDDKKHKYVAKIDFKKYKRYFYSLEAYRAYLSKKKQQVKDVAKKVKTGISAAVNFVKKSVNKISKKTVSELKEPSEKVKNFVSEALDKLTNKDNKKPKYLYKEKIGFGKYRYFYSEKEHDVWLEKQKYLANEPDFMKDIPKTKDMTDPDAPVVMSADNCKAANDGWHTEDYTTNNCFFCTTAYELRQRGYDVVAKQTETGTLGMEAYEIFENPQITAFTEDVENNPDELKRQLIEMSGAGSRGNICIRMKPYGGHSMAYEISPDGKEVVIVDAQTNDNWSLEWVAERINAKPASTGRKEDSSMFFRTDNLKLKEAALNLVQPANTKPQIVWGEEDLVSDRKSQSISDWRLSLNEEGKKLYDELFDEDGRPKKSETKVFDETDFPESEIRVTWR